MRPAKQTAGDREFHRREAETFPTIDEDALERIWPTDPPKDSMPNLKAALNDPRGVSLAEVLIAAEKDRPGSVVTPPTSERTS